MVAIFGEIIPTPLTAPARVIVAPPALNVVDAVLGRVSVVMIARAKSPRPSSRNDRAASAAPALNFSKSYRCPMTPVDDGTTSSGAHPSKRATSAHDSHARCSPALPVKLFAHPEFATIACRRPDLTRSAVT